MAIALDRVRVRPVLQACQAAEGDADGGSVDWLSRITALSETTLEAISPLVNTEDALQTIRALIGMLPALSDPPFAEWMRMSRDECVYEVFRFRTIQLFIEHGGHEGVASVVSWCRSQLESIAAADADDRALILEWCHEMIALLTPRRTDPGDVA